MGHAVTVRKYRETDFAAVAAVYADAKLYELRSAGCDAPLVPLNEETALLAAFQESDVLVYDADGVSGFAATCGGQLRALFVHGTARGRGIGSALPAEVLKANPGELSLHVAESNEPAMQLYRRHGFVATSNSIRHYHDWPLVYTLMCRAVHRH